ncbi:transposase [Sporolactobacillus sp. STCC-11]|uniref:RNA-guided endonuclease InsQ/TnpB family protein n=1 Tax=Sporolactobacillus caesalpiniae TaxID=3230362 RepID=UPI0033993ACD
MIKTHKIKLYPNATMKRHLDQLFNYHRYCWNLALETWNTLYELHLIDKENNKKPNEYAVRNELVAHKEDWQYGLSARVLQQSVASLSKAWKNFFNPQMPHHDRPKFKSKKLSKKSFTTDRAKIKNGKLMLDKPRGINVLWYGIKMAESPRFEGQIKMATVVEEADGLYACLSIDTNDNELSQGKDVAGVDVNIGHFNYNDGKTISTLPDHLIKLYERITHYQRLLARKRVSNPNQFRSTNYRKVRTKLKRSYQRIARIQEDLLKKFVHQLSTDFHTICIEDLDVNRMKMNKRLAKNIHRSMFRKFRDMIQYKSEWMGNRFVVADRYYPSTQRCSHCNHVKTGKDKMTLQGDTIYHEHHTYRCYECGTVMNRDENAVNNLIHYAVGLTTEGAQST